MSSPPPADGVGVGMSAAAGDALGNGGTAAAGDGAAAGSPDPAACPGTHPDDRLVLASSLESLTLDTW